MGRLCQMLQIKQLYTTIYHPQMDRLVERMTQTLKDLRLLQKASDAFPHQWDCFLDPLLFALREAPSIFNRSIPVHSSVWVEASEFVTEPAG